MAIANRPYGRVLKGHMLPYGTMADASPELRRAYYYHGYLHDEDMPPLPCPPPDLDEPYICPEEELFKKEVAAALNEALDGLSPRASKVLRLRFGFDGGCDLTLEEVGAAFHVGRERARQIEAKAIRLLKHPKRKLHDLLWPETQEEVIIRGKHEQRMHEESMERWKAQREEMRKRTVKQKLVQAYKEGDTSWLDYLAREEPEIYAQMQERIKSVLAKYE